MSTSPPSSPPARALLLALLAFSGYAAAESRADDADAAALSSVVPLDEASPVAEQYKNTFATSCVAEALEGRLTTPRRLIFGEIDMVAGFEVLPETLEIEFTLLAPTHGWVGFGVSEVGSMKGADIVVIEPGAEDGSFELTDHYSKDFVEPTVDKIQSWELLSASHDTIFVDCGEGEEEASLTVAVVRRMLETCDAEDLPLTPEYLHNYFIAAYGNDDQRNLSYHAMRASTGGYMHIPRPLIPKSAKGSKFVIETAPLSVPAGVSNYCYARIIIDRPIMVTAYTAIHLWNIHHIGLFKALSINFAGDYECTPDFDGMGNAQLQWAVGLDEIIIPSGLYIKLAPGEYFYEIHFENPAGGEFNTTAGMLIHAIEDETQVSKEDEVELLTIGSRFSDPIPPGTERVEKRFALPSVCLDDLPANGVTMMVSAPHMHKRGVAMEMYRKRGERTELVYEQRSFDFDKQNPLWKPWTLMPGDELYWKCTWDTSNESEDLPWGFSSDEEMCSVTIGADTGSRMKYFETGLVVDGKTFAYCSESRPRFDDDEEIRRHITNPPSYAIAVETSEPPEDAYAEKGRDRNVCQALTQAEVAAPANNWLWGSPIFYVLLSWLLQAGSQRGIRWWCNSMSIQRDRPKSWFAGRSMNFMEMVMCWSVLILVLVNFDDHFSVETTETYKIVGTTPLGARYRQLNAAGDYIAATYIIIFVLKAAFELKIIGEIIHHGTSLAIIWLLRNAVEYEYAPSFLCFFASCMIVHSGAVAPVYTSYLLVRLNPNPRKYGKHCAIMLIVSSLVRQCIVIVAHVASFWNYRLFFDKDTYKLRDVSTADWNSKPYFEDRLTARDYWLNVPWMEILMYSLPILWVILALAQFYNTRLQIEIGMFEYNKVHDDEEPRSTDNAKGNTSQSIETTVQALGESHTNSSESNSNDDLRDEEVARNKISRGLTRGMSKKMSARMVSRMNSAATSMRYIFEEDLD